MVRLKRLECNLAQVIICGAEAPGGRGVQSVGQSPWVVSRCDRDRHDIPAPCPPPAVGPKGRLGADAIMSRTLHGLFLVLLVLSPTAHAENIGPRGPTRRAGECFSRTGSPRCGNHQPDLGNREGTGRGPGSGADHRRSRPQARHERRGPRRGQRLPHRPARAGAGTGGPGVRTGRDAELSGRSCQARPQGRLTERDAGARRATRPALAGGFGRCRDPGPHVPRDRAALRLPLQPRPGFKTRRAGRHRRSRPSDRGARHAAEPLALRTCRCGL